MKRIITYISILAVAMTAGVSCSREASFDGDQEGGMLSLYFKTAEMSTRVSVVDGTPVTGVGAENTIDHIDYFFFADENPDSEAIVSGRATSTQLTKVSDTEYKYDGFDTSLSEYAALKGPSYLYVLVNYPETVSVKTMNELLALPISTDLSAANALFVMDSFENSGNESGLIYLTPKANAEVREQVVEVSRVAAKLVLNFTVAKEYIDGTKDKWTPVLDQMWWNFLYARKTGAFVNAAPQAFDTKDNYYNTAPDVAPIALNGGALNADNKYEYTTDPVYTYPQSYKTSDVTAPYYKLFLPWVSQKKGQNNFYYKIILPNLPMEGGENGVNYFQRNKIYQLKVDVSVLGGTEDDWALFSDYIFVADWYSPGEIATSVESARYLDVPVKKYEIYGINEITVPVVSSNDIRIVSCVGRQQTVKETLNTTYSKTVRSHSCVADGSDSFTLTYNLDPVITTGTNNSFDCTPIEWTVTIQHVQTTDPPSLSKTVTVTIIQYPSIYAKLIEGGNSFVNGYYSLQTASVTPTPNVQSSRTGGGSTWYYYRNNGTIANNYTENNNRVITGDNLANSYGYMNNDYTRTSTMTYVTVSAFSEESDSYTVVSNGDGAAAKEFEYIIGDPRMASNYTSSSLLPYVNGNEKTNWGATQAASIKIGTNLQKNLIAPAFMVASERGGRPASVGGELDFEGATKRCATYQEAGFPAGRWRLPTEAELYFLYSLQRMNVIANLFNGGNGYWASSGNVFGEEVNNVVSYTFRAANAGHDGAHSIRCIYDVWFWGETPQENVHTYYPGTLN